MRLDNIDLGEAGHEWPNGPETETPLGKLLLALQAENTWSEKYKVSARFGTSSCYLQITHGNLECVKITVREAISVSDVERMLSEKMDCLVAGLQFSRDVLERELSAIRQASEQIPQDKALAIIAEKLSLTPKDLKGLYCVGIRLSFAVFHNKETEELLIARRLSADDENFSGGIARISYEAHKMPYTTWMQAQMKSGHADCKVFWEWLARTYISQQKVPVVKLLLDTVVTSERKHTRGFFFAPNIHRIDFRTSEEHPKKVVVVFTDELPSSVEVTELEPA